MEGRHLGTRVNDSTVKFELDFFSEVAIGGATYVATQGACDNTDSSDAAQNVPCVVPTHFLDSAAAITQQAT